MKFYDIVKGAIPDNLSIESTKDFDKVITKITSVILTSINQFSKAKIINGPHKNLPSRFTNEITLRNQIKKRWHITYEPRFKRKSPSSTMKSKLTSNNMIKTLGPNGLLASIRKTYLSTTELGNSQGSFTKSLLFLIRLGSSTPPSEKRTHLSTLLKIPSRQTLIHMTIDTSPKLIKQSSISSIAREMTTISRLPLPSKFKL
ncbi:hypothetical protein AVEN_128868-1 [Araneus ventricosus]|uniref:Uncharacterized protein n=1 Tax=Araneus ventricosus TaxID=182803 RepID=A0A4Y2JZN4_ARAVE|nr:hypothetical protein AVEN_226810-1 [Araneus ventricosus]GBM95701.1 hypothetical protein AVEN_21252-1 [Araneus ventricosus]GBM95717.1 hypothetical protein AVEN_43233-1 [Araneus ventricosus]GBM95786.1 hypothetical protein AVEN_128868-1 [Araneus ventricosus]